MISEQITKDLSSGEMMAKLALMLTTAEPLKKENVEESMFKTWYEDLAGLHAISAILKVKNSEYFARGAACMLKILEDAMRVSEERRTQ